MRKLNDSDVVNKTISSFDNSCCNILKLNFTDGTTLELCAEVAVCIGNSVIPGIFVEESETHI